MAWIVETLGNWPAVLIGLVALVSGGDALVKGAVSLALRLGIPALIVGLTVVAFGTSAPELLVSVTAALKGTGDIAMGNVVGSNIVNILLILGLPVLLRPIPMQENGLARSYLMMLAASLLLIALAFTGRIVWWHGALLVGGLGLMIWDNVRQARAHREAAAAAGQEVEDAHLPPPLIGLYIVGGLVLLGLGARLLVDGAVNIARDWGIPEAVIGLTLVAIGTSLPELVTSVVAAVRGKSDVAMGNIIGSNLFNILCILGFTALIAPVAVGPQFVRFDLWVMLGVALLLVPFVFLHWRIGRRAGVAFVAIYAAYTLVLLNLPPALSGAAAAAPA